MKKLFALAALIAISFGAQAIGVAAHASVSVAHVSAPAAHVSVAHVAAPAVHTAAAPVVAAKPAPVAVKAVAPAPKLVAKTAAKPTAVHAPVVAPKVGYTPAKPASAPKQ